MDVEVDVADLGRTRVVPGRPLPDEPSSGTALLRIALFAITANNVTYGAVGGSMGYWRFFPASEDGWGRIPVWGYADVEASACDGVLPGERYFGFWPMSTHLLVEPAAVSSSGFVDGTAHRNNLPPIYNRYNRSAPAAEADTDAEARNSIWQPLFVTAFLLDDWLAGESVFGAQTVLITSASSKTALGLAHLLTANQRAEIVGITSAANADFISDSGVYDRIVTYDSLPEGLGEGPAVLVDMAGDPTVLGAVHGQLGERLLRSVSVGFTHHEAPAAPVAGLPGPAPAVFFAPDHAVRRIADWGPGGFAARLDHARRGFDQGAAALIEIDRCRGADAIISAWRRAVDGSADPRRGVVCSW